MGHAAESETQMDDLAAAVREATERVHGTEQQQPAPVDAEQPVPADAASQTPPATASEPEESLAEAQAPPADPAAPQDDADAVDMSDTIPVSYTHLDVYKRQNMKRTARFLHTVPS